MKKSLLLAVLIGIGILGLSISETCEAKVKLREVSISYPGDVSVAILLEKNYQRPGYKLSQPIRFALDTKGHIANFNKRKYAILEADLSLYAPGYPKPIDPYDNDSAIPIMTFGEPHKNIEKRNVLSWNDDSITYIRNALNDICVNRDERNRESWHNIDLIADVRVKAGKKKGFFDKFTVYGKGNPYPNWIDFQTKTADTFFPARVRCPAEQPVSTSGADIARDYAREPINVEEVRLFSVPLNPGYCPRKIVMRAEFEGRGRGRVKYELRSSGRDPIFRRLTSLERKPNNRFIARDDLLLTFNSTTDLVYWVQTIGDPENTRSGPERVSVRCELGGGDSEGEFTLNKPDHGALP